MFEDWNANECRDRRRAACPYELRRTKKEKKGVFGSR